MLVRYEKQFSRSLSRTMESKVFGHAGKPVIVFPSQNGRFYDYENYGMVDALKGWIDAGRICLICVDSIDRETWSNECGDGHARIALQECYIRYLTEEIVPYARALCNWPGRMMTTGCSLGAMHAANLFFRFPNLFDEVISLSGVYDARLLFPNYSDLLTYLNSPVECIANMPEDHPYIRLYNESTIVLCVGSGAWEDELRASTFAMREVLAQKHIRAWVDVWGPDSAHDWPWWQRQIRYFFSVLHGETDAAEIRGNC